MKFLRIEDEVIYSKKRYKLKREIDKLFLDEEYFQIEPQLFEEYDEFTTINNKIPEESMVKVVNGKVMVLRADITTSIIKSLVPRWEDGLKLKLFYNSSIYKNKNTVGIKEIRQIGCEYLGEASVEADREVVKLALKILEKYNNNFILEVGSSKYIHGLLEELNLNKNCENQIKNLLYTKNTHELKVYIEELKIKREVKELLSNILSLQGNLYNVIEKSNKFYCNNKMKQALEELKQVNNLIEECNFLDKARFDLSMITMLDYYEGIMFRGYYPNSYKEILSGGRYDSLTKEYGKEIPAIGFTLSVDELMKYVYK
ncbi:TPA: ATP phosphoribosyltransferase regulatory subunit [Clostridioides difficile]|uniref:ATP phosphoribosyltransferase regulatory subunit n=14 Tax=Clostridioides difficile TaxID=1496 RepID=A0A9Q9TSU5_CLODI|nr:ATP phosphoribosyltransferase regulatory subunit [Clostridioides difficile]EQG61281.1 histidyl-tRNA synthetase family protein [Clostridioides difficile DA00149]EQG75261.1 histidyl-tRNA synthetase family protein [Clostridioides difficile DA00165]EQI38279.1 histidyl-tRNA synthetase family protein [Clostridioides difficile Y184]EQK92531.1 histidyl-tRNA synthetase family protein [Clostridioides difficile CD127]OFU02029.1 ATP phosphoribosyltransferase regulatory subunit [Clostridium sp. HMSC19E0